MIAFLDLVRTRRALGCAFTVATVLLSVTYVPWIGLWLPRLFGY